MEENNNNNTNNYNYSSPVVHGNNMNISSTEAVRSRWTPKPEQILILESIFNSGMVNPPKDETVKIRKLLEKFGAVGDANVFYWFQNRRSRSRRRQRQIQAATATATATATTATSFNNNNNISHCLQGQNIVSDNEGGSPYYSCHHQLLMGASSSSNSHNINYNNNYIMDIDDANYNMFNATTSSSSDLDIDNNSMLPVPCSSNYQFQPGAGNYITVVINGVPTEVPRGPLDMKAMFGEDVVLIHSSSGLPLPFHAFSLQHGQSYFLVSTST